MRVDVNNAFDRVLSAFALVMAAADH